MNSERHRVQTYIEDAIGCPDPQLLRDYRSSFEEFTVGHVAKGEIDQRMAIDAEAYSVKGIRSLIQALEGLDRGNETWSVVKFYYSMYYFMRAKLAYSNLAFLRCINIYTLQSNIGETPAKRTGKRYQGDHKATISIFSQEFAERDYYLSQSIADLSPFQWYSSKREWVNYKRRDFIDKLGMDGLGRETESYERQVARYCEQPHSIFCFEPDHALIALPVSFALSEVQARRLRPNIAETITLLSSEVATSGSARVWLNSL